MAKAPKEMAPEGTPVLTEDEAAQINSGRSSPRNSTRTVEYEVPEDEKLEGIDLVKINEIISSSDVQKGGFIRLERRGPFDSGFSYLVKLKPDEFDIDRIMKLYGGGDYQGRTFRSNGQMYKMFTFSIDSRRKGALDESEIKALAEQKDGDVNKRLLDAALAPKTSLGLDQNPTFLSRILDTQAASGNQTMTMMMTMMQQMTQQMLASQENSTKMMIAMMTANRAEAKPAGGADPTLMLLVEILKEKASGDPVEKMMKLMSQAKELVAGAPKPDEPPFWEKLATAAAPAVIGMLGGGRPPMQVTDQGQVPTAVQPQPQPQLKPDQPDMNAFAIRMFLNQVLSAAAKGSDPGLYADMIFDNVSETQLEEIKQHLTAEAWPANLFGDDPRTVSCRAWLDQLKAIMLADDDATPEPSSVEPVLKPVPESQSD